ncbi:trypsin-like peptidase domain-containing protein [Phycicoccus sp. Root101]|uniref:trypsin-like peptidase domain-containing protein n=1 Tax=Phycicoccus sp. Root101 TaxID=1736421 RepID=UPI000B0DE7ED|nr:trypsin-like peptidase domain-containing protein [Phycicoccus sp. Root101]
MTQIHQDTQPGTTGEGGQPPQQHAGSTGPVFQDSGTQPGEQLPLAPMQQPPIAPAQESPAQASTPQPPTEPFARPDDTAPVWFGQTQSFSRDSATPGAPGGSGAFGPYGTGEHTAYPPTAQPPAGPPPPAHTRDGAEPAQPGNRRRWTELTAVAALAALLASGGTYAAAQLTDGTQSSSTASSSTLGRGADAAPVVQADATNPNWTATAAAVSPSVVSITVASSSSEGQGSGVVIDGKGHILTNNHVVAGAGQNAKLTVTLNDGRTYSATVAGTDPTTDLAVITLTNPPSNLTPIAIGNSDAIKVGDPVMAIGNPLGLAGTVTTGIVSALNRPVTTAAEDDNSQQQNPFGQGQAPQTQTGGNDVVTNAIQTSAAINPGNSGGALVNASGQLVGINSAIASLGSSSGSSQSGSIGIGFAIPANEAKSIATQLIDKGTAEHAFLGVSLADGTASDGTSQRAGAEVSALTANTPAAQAGLQKGDVVVAVDGERVDSALALVATIRERAVGDKVALTVLRGGKQLDLTATLVAKSGTTQ